MQCWFQNKNALKNYHVVYLTKHSEPVVIQRQTVECYKR